MKLFAVKLTVLAILISIFTLITSCGSGGINSDIKEGVSIAGKMEDAMKIAKTGNPEANQMIQDIETEIYTFLAEMRVKHTNEDYQKIDKAVQDELARVMKQTLSGY